MAETIRVAAIQTRRRTLPYKIPVTEALELVRKNLIELVALAEQAAEKGCHIIAFPEDTLGTLEWEAARWNQVAGLLRPAEQEMLTRFGEVAAKHGVCLIGCNDFVQRGHVYNTAILIGSDGREIGRYHKVHLPLPASTRTSGTHFPVFQVPGIGAVGMCICYYMILPETTRALALGGADLVFHLTMGGASMAGGAASRAAFITRAADNFLYLVVAFRGEGSLIISPKGDILAEGGKEPDAIVMADIDLTSGREAGDALGGITTDFRARLFRERVPRAYGILMEGHPPILAKLQGISVPSPEEAAALFAEGLTTGADAFYEADRWLGEGRLEEAKARFEALAERFGTLWIGRAARERLRRL